MHASTIRCFCGFIPVAAATLVVVGILNGCVGVPANRPYVDWGPEDHGAVGASLYDSTAPTSIVEGAAVFGAMPVGPIDLAASLQLDFAQGLSNGARLGGGGMLGLRYRWRLIDQLEVVPEVSAGLASMRSPNGIRILGALAMVDFSVRYKVVEPVWVYVRPGVGGGASVFGTAVGGVFPAIRFSYGAQWAIKPWLRFFLEGSLALEVGAPNLALGVLTVF